MMQLVNVKTGAPEDVGEDGLISALAAGTHTPAGGKALLNPDGELVISPNEDVSDNLTRYGYAVPTQEQLTKLSNQKQYGSGFVQPAIAGIEGALSGATFGVSRQLENASGITTPEAQAARQEENPGISTTGEIGGAIGSALLAPETAPAALLGKLGSGIAKKLAPKALEEGASLASRALNFAARTGSQATGSAVEGAGYGLGQTVSEDALGDPEAISEKLMSNVGYGALFGGGLGGLIKAGEAAVPASLGAVKNALSETYGKLVGKVGSGGEYEAGPLTKAGAAFSGAITGEDPAEIIDYAAKMKTGEYLSPKEFSDYKKDFRESLQNVYDSTKQASYDASTGARNLAIGELTKDVDPAMTGTGLAQLHDQIGSVIDVIDNNPKKYTGAALVELEKLQGVLQDAVSGETGVSDGIKYAVPSTASKQFLETADVKKRLYRLFKDLTPKNAPLVDKTTGGLVWEAYQGAQSLLHDEDIWGQAAVSVGKFNDAVADHINATEQFEQEFMTKKKIGGKDVFRMNTPKLNNFWNNIKDDSSLPKREAASNLLAKSNNLVDAIDEINKATPFGRFNPEAMRSLVDKNVQMANNAQNIIEAQPDMGFGGLANLAHKAGRGDFGGASLLGLAAKSLVDPYTTVGRLANMERAAQDVTAKISKSGSAVFQTATSGASSIAGVIGGTLGAEAVKKQYEKTSKRVQDFNASPDKAIDQLDYATQDMYHVAPKISSSLQMKAANASQFLGSKIPNSPATTLPYDKKFEPTHPQMVKFNRYYNAVHRPLTVLEDLKSGITNPESIEALQAVYPRLYSQMKTSILDAMSSHLAKEKPLAYQQRMAIGHFLGQPIDSTMSPQFLQANQLALNMPSRQNSEDKLPAAATGKLTLGDRFKTNMQSSTQRELT